MAVRAMVGPQRLWGKNKTGCVSEPVRQTKQQATQGRTCSYIANPEYSCWVLAQTSECPKHLGRDVATREVIDTDHNSATSEQ